MCCQGVVWLGGAGNGGAACGTTQPTPSWRAPGSSALLHSHISHEAAGRCLLCLFDAVPRAEKNRKSAELDAFESKSALCESSRVKRPGTGSGPPSTTLLPATGKVVDADLRRHDDACATAAPDDALISRQALITRRPQASQRAEPPVFAWPGSWKLLPGEPRLPQTPTPP
jgi:hypothetical protein